MLGAALAVAAVALLLTVGTPTGTATPFARAPAPQASVPRAELGSEAAAPLSPPVVVANTTLSGYPGPPLYDPDDGLLYVPDEQNGSVQVFAGTALVTAFSLGGYVGGGSLDPRSGDVYFAGGTIVAILHGASELATATVAHYTIGTVFDPANGYDYVVEGYGGLVAFAGTHDVGIFPYGAQCPTDWTYDPADRLLYVVDICSGNIDLYRDLQPVASVFIGGNPFGLTYDPADRDVYVSMHGANDRGYLTVLRGRAIVGNVSVGCGPGNGTYDPADRLLYVPNGCSGNVSVVRSDFVITSLPIGAGPGTPVFQAGTDALFVPYGDDGNLTILTGLDEQGSVSLGGTFVGAVDDPATEQICAVGYVGTDFFIGQLQLLGAPAVPVQVSFAGTGLTAGTPWNVTVREPIGNVTVAGSAATLHLFLGAGTYGYRVGVPFGYSVPDASGSVSLGHAAVTVNLPFANAVPVGPQHPVASVPTAGLPTGAIYDPADGTIDVLGQGGTITILQGLTALGQIASEGDFSARVYDPADGDVYLGAYYYDNLVVLNGSHEAGVVPLPGSPFAMVYDAALGEVLVAGQASSGAVVEGLQGLAVQFTLDLGGLSGPAVYDPMEEAAVFGSTTGLLFVNATGIATNVSGFGVVANVAYDPVDQDVYAVTGAQAVVVLHGTQVVATLEPSALGLYATNVSVGLGTGLVYITGADRGGISVLQGSTVLAAALRPGLGRAPLPGSASGLVDVPESSNDTVTLFDGSEAVGVLRTGAAPNGGAYDPASGLLYLTNGGSSNVTVLGPPATESIVFAESGLLQNQSWSVTLGDATYTTNASTIGFAETNGSYPYTIVAPPGYTLGPVAASGTVVLDGTTAEIPVQFTPGYTPFGLFPVTFRERGLPNQTNWSVTVAQSPDRTRTNESGNRTGALAFFAANGTLDFSIAPPAGYGVRRILGDRGTTLDTTLVRGPTTVTIDFAPLRNVTFEESGLAAGAAWGVTLHRAGAGVGPPNVTAEGNTPTLTLSVVAGAWQFRITETPSGYRAQPVQGRLLLGRAGTTVLIRFTASAEDARGAGSTLAARAQPTVVALAAQGRRPVPPVRRSP